MIVHWPGRKGEVIEYRTEHFDIAPTIVGQALGCDATPPRVYATGNGLFQRPDRNWSIAHSYMAFAIQVDGYQIVQRPSGGVETVNDQLNPAPAFSADPQTIEAVLREMSRFYR